MAVVTPIGGFGQRRDAVCDGEHPDVVLRDVANRARGQARIITVANEKGGVGKSTLAFHLCVALADCGHKVLAVDLDRRQQTLARALTNRDATARRLRVRLPQPRHLVLQHTSGAQLCQEIARAGWDCDYVLIDAPGHDSGIARRAIALADQLISPVNSSFVDLDLLGRFQAGTDRLLGLGCFAAMVGELRAARATAGLRPLDWLVMQNRKRRDCSRNQARIDSALQRLAPRANFRIGAGLNERVAYRELLPLGLSHIDLKRIAGLARTRAQASCEITGLLDDLQLEPAAGALLAGMTEPALRELA